VKRVGISKRLVISLGQHIALLVCVRRLIGARSIYEGRQQLPQ